MTEAELQEQIELQNRTIAELKDKLAAAVPADYQALKDAAGKSAADLEAVKAQLAKVEPTLKENEQLKAQLFVSGLRAKYPDVDPALIPAGKQEEMDAFAAKLQGMVSAAVAKVKPGPAPGPGERFNNMPPMGGVHMDVVGKAEAEKTAQKAITDAVKSGDAKATLDAILAAKPGALAALYKASGDPNFKGSVPAQV